MGTTTFKRKFRTHGINYIKKESDTFDPFEWCKLEKTKSYGVRRLRSKVKTLLLQRWALIKFHVRGGQNTRDQITSDRRSKRAWSHCIMCIPFILSGSPNEYCIHICDACLTTTWRLGLLVTTGARNELRKRRINNRNMVILEGKRFARRESLIEPEIEQIVVCKEQWKRHCNSAEA